MDIEALMTQKGMRDFTDEQRQTFTTDATQLRQLAQIIQARLAHTQIDGDRTGSAGRRARKVARRLTKVARLVEKAAAETEAVNAVYLREVVELPARRARELEKKNDRRQRLGIAAASVHDKVGKSLTTSTNTLTGVQPTMPAQPPTVGQPAVQYVNPQPFQFPGQPSSTAAPVPHIGDFFGQQEAL
ncbi:hypothetical protein D0Z67_29160 (plasmid) [Streptomyces seoulensis]|uniref:Uncharacterized protein n=1 Tax=Streptomyces seoulensis TaxID=73044 RepID=A0A4P6U3C2_STRSO|nr:hypothetical protein [Streptomyces seoulensis]QBJ94440.1 hypothetical protein D0Z67_29160 [Streptomyces seoulensis]